MSISSNICLFPRFLQGHPSSEDAFIKIEAKQFMKLLLNYGLLNLPIDLRLVDIKSRSEGIKQS